MDELNKKERKLNNEINLKKNRNFLRLSRSKSGINVLIIEDDLFLSRDYGIALSSIGGVNVYSTGDAIRAII